MKPFFSLVRPARFASLRFIALTATVVFASFATPWGADRAAAAAPLSEPVVARIEMKLAINDEVVNVIEQGDLLTVLEEREDDYVIVTHDGSKGAVDKVNAVRIAESSQIYTELIERHPDEGRYYTLRAAAWWALGKVEQALADFDQAIEMGYTESHAYTSRGLFHAEMGNFDQAIADYNQSLELEPEAIAPIINRAAVHMSRGDYEQAIADYTLILEKKPGNASILHQRAIALKTAGKLDQAADDFTTILKAQPKDRAAVMGRGYVRFQQLDYHAAIADFSKAIEMNNQDAVALNNRGYNRFQVGQFAGALEDYNDAIALAPKYALALQNRAWLLATATDESFRDAAKAVQSAKAACEVTNYRSISDLSALAASLAADGKFDEAVGWQEKVVQGIGPAYQEFAKKILVRYENELPFTSNPDADTDVATDGGQAEPSGTEG